MKYKLNRQGNANDEKKNKIKQLFQLLQNHVVVGSVQRENYLTSNTMRYLIGYNYKIKFKKKN